MDQLADTLRENVFWYAGTSPTVRTFKLANDTEHVYAVNIVNTHNRQLDGSVMVIARVQGDYVIIEEDLTDKPLVERLVAAGISRDKIICAYLGEPIPDIQAN